MLGREELLVVFFCEGDITHRAPHPGYKLIKPNEFLRKYGKWIALGLQLLQFALQASPLPVALPAGLPNLVIVSKDAVAGKIIEYTNDVLNSASASIMEAGTGTGGEVPKEVQANGTGAVLDEGMQRTFLGTRCHSHFLIYVI